MTKHLTAERWQKIKEVFHAALEREASERSAFLDEACAGDEELRREVESLVAGHQQPDTFLDGGAFEVASDLLSTAELPVAVGRAIGPYKIICEIGRGGMGEVYLAQDSRLGRPVALKLLPSRFTTDEGRLRRFRQEARAASALNHPNIITIHEVGQIDAAHFIATEFVEGRTLRSAIESGGMKVDEALDIVIQVASALRAAHEAGIVHRDIKPENIMLRPDGYVKVVDFGLAKLSERRAVTDDTRASFSAIDTNPGIVMGTVSYMSPEQARGLAVDGRGDIFSLGVVLYEVLAGRPPFQGATISDLIVAILEKDPPALASLRTETPAEIESIINKALRKNVGDRYQTAKEMLDDLRKLKQDLEIQARIESSSAEQFLAGVRTRASGEQASTGQGGAVTESNVAYSISKIKLHKRSVLLAVGVALIAGAAYWLYHIVTKPGLAVETAISNINIRPLTSLPGQERFPAFSPDGKQIAFTWKDEKDGNADIYVEMIDAGTPLRLTNNRAREIALDWSPDGGHIAFLRASERGEGLYLIPALGGAERELLFSAADQPLKLFSSSLESPRLSWSPDGKLLAFAAREGEQLPSSIYLFSLDKLEKHKLTSQQGVSYGDGMPDFSTDGKTLAFVRQYNPGIGALYVVPTAGGEPKEIVSGEWGVVSQAWLPNSNELLFSTTRTNLAGVWRVSADGGAPQPVAKEPFLLTLAINHQGDRLAFERFTADLDIWQYELSAKGKGKSPVKLIYSTRYDGSPQFSRDGKRIVFVSHRSGNGEIWLCDSKGANPLQLTHFNGPDIGSPRWSPDGRFIAFDALAKGNRDIYVISAAGGEPRAVTNGPSDEVRPSWSKNGQWIYFGSNQASSWQVWKVSPEGDPGGQVTVHGGVEAVESPDGTYLYFSKSPGLTGLWRKPTAGGEETLVLDNIYQGFWAALDVGVYFLNPRARPRPGIEFLSFATGQKTPVAAVDQPPLGHPGLAVSPNGERLLLMRSIIGDIDIMLIENFR